MRLVPAFTTKAWERFRRRSGKLPPESVRPHFLLLALDSVGEAVAAIDRGGRVIYCNNRFEDLFGPGRLGEPLEEWLQAAGARKEDDSLPLSFEDSAACRALRGQIRAEARAFLRTPRAPKGIFLRESARPVLAPNGLILGAVTVIRAELL